jgi:hypothetical protein
MAIIVDILHCFVPKKTFVVVVVLVFFLGQKMEGNLG